MIYITNEAVGRVDYYQLISGKSEKNNCFSKFSSDNRKLPFKCGGERRNRSMAARMDFIEDVL